MKRRIFLIVLALCMILSLESMAFASGETGSSEEATVLIEETTTCNSFSVPEGMTAAAPEGKLLTMTVDGIETEIIPGVEYTGDIVLTVTDKMPVYGHEDSAADWEGSDFRAAVYLDDSGLEEDASVLAAAPDAVYEDGILTAGTIESQGTTFNGIIVNGGSHEIKDAYIILNGDGGNDFDGYGAAILATGDSEVVIDNAFIDTTGLTRGAMATAGDAKVLVMNSVYHAHEGILPDDYVMNVENVSGIMKSSPWTLGITGTNRATNLLGNGASTYFNSEITADGWGVLSADDAVAPKMTLVNTTVFSSGECAYGTFGIGDGSEIRILGSRLDVTGMLVNMAGGTLLIGPATEENLEGAYGADTILASGALDSETPSVLRSSGEGIRAGGGEITVQPGTVIDTGKALIVAKGGGAVLSFDGAEIHSDSGIILQMQDSDDAGANFMVDGCPLNETYTEGDVEPVYIEGRDLTKINHDYEGQSLTIEEMLNGASLSVNGSSGLALEISFANMDIDGDFYNGTESFTTAEKVGVDSTASNLFLTFTNTTVDGVISAALAEHVDPVTGEVLKTIDNWSQVSSVQYTVRPVINNGVNVELADGSTWTVTGTSYLSSLTIGDGCEVIGTMTVDGVAVEPAAGTYVGAIVLDAITASN